MRRLGHPLWVFLATLVLLAGRPAALAAPAAAESSAPVKFAVLAFRPKPETLARWQPLVDYLNAAGIGRQFVLVALTYPEMEAAVKTREVGVVLVQPAFYILLAHREGLYSPIATLVDKGGGFDLSSFGGVIAVREGQTAIRSIGDLRGKRIAVSDTDSLGGYLMQALELQEKGVDLPGEAQVLTTGVPHDKAIQALLAGHADAAFVRTGVIEAMAREGKLGPGRIRVLEPRREEGFPFALSTRLYPEWAVSAMPWLDGDLTRRVAVAILGMPHGGKVAAAVGIQGFTVPGNYQPVEEMMRRMRVPPFDTAPSFTARDVWLRYQTGIASLASVGFVFLLLLAVALLRSNRGLQVERGEIRSLLKQLRESESRYRSLVDSSPDWIWEVDARGAYTYVSPRVTDILGYAPEEMLGRTPFEFMTAAEADRVRAEFADAMQAKRAFSGLENVNRHKSGHEVVLETSGVPNLGDRGELLGYRGVDRDITARKQVEQELAAHRAHLEALVEQRTQALAAAETRYRTVADFAYDWETWIGPDGGWLYCSPSCRRLTGHGAEEFVQRPQLFVEIVHPEDRAGVASHLAEHSCCSDDVGRITFRIVRPDGAIAWLEHICQPVLGEDGEYLGRRASNRDISERKRAEIELIKARDAAMVANVAKDAFLANMSHEMRTPLHQIGGMAQLVRREPLTPRQQERLDKHDAALRNMTGLVEKLLQLTRIEADSFQAEEAPVDVALVMRKVVAMMQGKAEAKGLQFLAESEAIPAGLLGDALHIQAALTYLVENAVKFTETGSVAVWAKVEQEGEADVLVRFEVEDTGIGIDPEALPRLFNVFEQADNSMTRRHGGAGIGLAMVRRLARLMGGDAGCSSLPGAGSTFWFTARLKKAA